jgi:hypothetical protein
MEKVESKIDALVDEMKAMRTMKSEKPKDQSSQRYDSHFNPIK